MGGGVLKAAAGICEEVLERLPLVQWVSQNRTDSPGLSGSPVSVKSLSWADVVSGCIRSRARHSE